MTEVQLFNALDRVRPDALALHRIECTTLSGVSDIEYVGAYTHGWIELKIASMRTLDSPLTFQHPATPEQIFWLLKHHCPRIRLASGLLVGVVSRGRWLEFLLMKPKVTAWLLA